jgi:hypothetical protein
MWILPSYKRPDNCRKVLEAAVFHGLSTPGVLIVNGPMDGYDSISLPPSWQLHHEPVNIGFAAALNKGFLVDCDADWYGVLSDDTYPETSSWDSRLVEAAGTRNISHCNDHWHSETRAAGIVVIGGDLVRAIGFLTVPGTWHCYCDDLWESIWADFGNRKYLRDVSCHNPHPQKGDAPEDETIRLAYGDGFSRMIADGVVFRNWMASDEKRVTWSRISELFSRAVAP